MQHGGAVLRLITVVRAKAGRAAPHGGSGSSTEERMPRPPSAATRQHCSQRRARGGARGPGCGLWRAARRLPLEPRRAHCAGFAVPRASGVCGASAVRWGGAEIYPISEPSMRYLPSGVNICRLEGSSAAKQLQPPASTLLEAAPGTYPAAATEAMDPTAASPPLSRPTRHRAARPGGVRPQCLR